MYDKVFVVEINRKSGNSVKESDASSKFVRGVYVQIEVEENVSSSVHG